jgi:tetratricopeptide (TPR) repeat protein
LGDLDKAIGYFRLAESQFAALGNRFEAQLWLGNIANVEESKQDYDDAALHYKEALAISRELDDESSIATWLNNLAAVSIERADWI